MKQNLMMMRKIMMDLTNNLLKVNDDEKDNDESRIIY